MVPIYESDVAEERWSEAEWKHYELWEKVEVRLRRQRRLWIIGTVIVFLLLSSVPIVLDQRPRWAAFFATRILAQEINGLKRGAALSGQAHRLRFTASPSLEYVVETAARCSSGEWTRIAQRSIPGGDRLVLVGAEEARSLGYSEFVTSLCYDPFDGATQVASAVGFGIAPVNDLTSGRTDRVSLLVLTGQSAEQSFD